jgi:hypothetical protein
MSDMPDKYHRGRKPKFRKVEKMQKAIDEYFARCDNRAIKVWDEKTQTEIMISKPAPYTMSGLASRLRMDRRSLVNYSNKRRFFPTIRDARERVHEDVETRSLETRNEKGAIFNLKNNFGWRDESQTDVTSGGQKMEGLIIYKPEKNRE